MILAEALQDLQTCVFMWSVGVVLLVGEERCVLCAGVAACCVLVLVQITHGIYRETH